MQKSIDLQITKSLELEASIQVMLDCVHFNIFNSLIAGLEFLIIIF